MDTTIEQQVAMDEALVPHAQRLRIGRSNFRLLSDIKSKESTLQLMYDVLHICPFFKAFLVTADPWRSFAAIINKCLTRKSSGYDSLRLSQAQILWGLYHKRNVDYTYLMWEDFVYQVEQKIIRRAMRCTILDSQRDDHMFSTIKLVSRHQNMQQFDALLPIEQTNEEIRNSKAYKEYYAVATGEAAPKPKASGKQAAKATKAKSLSTLSEVQMKELVPNQQFLMYHLMSQKKSSLEILLMTKVMTMKKRMTTVMKRMRGMMMMKMMVVKRVMMMMLIKVKRDDDKDDEEEVGDDEHESEEEEFDEQTRDRESFDPISKTPENSVDEGNGDEDLGLNVGGEEGHGEKEEADKLYRDVNINQGRGIQATLEVEDSNVTLTSVNLDGQQQSSSVSSQFVTSMLNSTLDVGIESIFETTSQLDGQTPTSVALLPMQTNQFAGAVSSIPVIVNRYMDQRMNEAVKVAVQIQSDRLRNEDQRENDEFLKSVDENMKKIIKEQVKDHVKTLYVVAADLFEMELKKILIKKIEGNKSIQRSDEQRNLYKALVEAYESDKIILDIYRETVTLKRRRDDDVDKDEEPFVGPDRGSKRRREGKEPESASAPSETATRSAGRSTKRSRSRQESISESALEEEHVQTTFQMEEPSYLEFDTGADDQPIVQSSQHPEWFSQQQKPPTLNCDWNKTLPVVHGSIQPWISKLNKDKKNRLIRIDELHKFSDETLTDVRTTLDDRLKGIRMRYLPQTIWRKSDKDRAAAMIQAIEKRLKTRGVMMRLERFIGGRLYKGDIRMLQRTI
nr:hypothetical protein [Tanacetum cinerariifolium]